MTEDKRYLGYLYAVCDLLNLFRREKGLAVCAVDGRCGSGKTSFAEDIRRETGGDIVHADDFYLQPYQRTPERYAEPGGNLDRERLEAEVLKPLREGKSAVYRVFDPKIMDFSGTREIKSSSLVIVEGSYSTHPDLFPYYDLTVFCTVDPAEQLRRITVRNGEEKAKQFRDRWIPLEELYFTGMDPASRCRFVFDM